MSLPTWRSGEYEQMKGYALDLPDAPLARRVSLNTCEDTTKAESVDGPDMRGTQTPDTFFSF